MEFKKGDTGVSKLKNFEAVYDSNGNHEVWNSPKGILYKFKVTLENGLIGTANSKTQTGDGYTTGQEYEYLIKFKNENFTNLKIGKPNNSSYGNSNSGNSKKDDPDTTKRIMMAVAVECVCNTQANSRTPSPPDFKGCLGLYVTWLMRKMFIEHPEDKQAGIDSQAALRRAVLLVGIDGLGVSGPSDVIIKASEFYNIIHNITWMQNKIQEMSSSQSDQSSNQNQSQNQNDQQNTAPPPQQGNLSDSPV